MYDHSLTIIIPTFNRKNYLEDLLLSLKNQDVTEIDIKIVVIVDGSIDGTIELLKVNYPYVDVIHGDGSWWWTKSINAGLERSLAAGEHTFLLMNDDTLIKENFLRVMLNSYISNGFGILGAISVTDSSPFKIFFSGIRSVRWSLAKFYRYHRHFESYNSSIAGVHKSIFLPGRGMMFNTDVLKKIGKFSEEIFPQYYSDFDFCYRAHLAGFSTNVNYDAPIYSYVKLTAAGNKSNTTFLQLLKSITKPMSSNYYKSTWLFFQRHAGILYPLSFFVHYFRIIGSFLLLKIADLNHK